MGSGFDPFQTNCACLMFSPIFCTLFYPSCSNHKIGTLPIPVNEFSVDFQRKL